MVPQFWQKVALVALRLLHFGHFFPGAGFGGVCAVVMFWPQLGQNFDVAGMWAWQLGQTTNATAASVPAPAAGWNNGGTRTIPVPNAAPPEDLPSSAAACLTVSIRITSSGETRLFSQNNLSLNSGVVSMPSNFRSII